MPKSKQQFYYNGFIRPTTTPVPDDIFDIIAPELTEAELRVLLYIVRRTFGFKKDHDSISLTQMVKGIKARDGKVLDRGTGMSRQGVMNGIKGLLEKGVIEVQTTTSADGDSDINVYSLRFQGGVVNEVDHPSQRSLLRVVNKVDPQQTVKQQTDTVVVINALKKFKIEEEKAEEIAARYPPEYIDGKIEFLEWKTETATRGRPVSDPAAWLIRAIEKDYKPPPDFKTKAQRQREAEELAQREVEMEAQRQEDRERETEERARHLEELRRTYGTTQKELDLWQEVLEEVKLSTTEAAYRTWFPHTALLSLKDGQAVIGVPNHMSRDWLSGRLAPVVQRALANVTEREVALEFVVLGEDSASP